MVARGSCHVSRWLQLQLLLSVRPSGYSEVKLWVCMNPSAKFPDENKVLQRKQRTGPRVQITAPPCTVGTLLNQEEGKFLP